MSNILIADDDHNIASLIADSLTDEGFTVTVAANGDDALRLALASEFNLILLDIMMPGSDGLEVCRKIRDKVHCPILFVTAKGRTIDTLLGLEIGADDYITKPFVVEELAAKVKAHLRRDKRKIAAGNRFLIGGLDIDRERFEVKRDGEMIPLSTREFQLLLYLCDNMGKVLTREQIFDAVWGMDYSDIGCVTVTIKNLRDKLDSDNHYIKTVWGVGYKFVRPER